MMQRFQFERLKFHEKNSAFNLPDNEDEELTHGGRALGEDDFDDAMMFNNSDEEEYVFLKKLLKNNRMTLLFASIHSSSILSLTTFCLPQK